MTFYRTYRPKTIEELDLAAVRDRLSAVVANKKFSHAYLFSGPRGTGKTSAARIMAREAGTEPEDMIELDAASHRGIDDIRELRERVGLAPMTGTRRAYIIDEVHMLTTEAFNALLKTLEEPPAHVMFFLCTTEHEKVPATIVSRCVSIPFHRATNEEIVRALRRTLAGEKLQIEEETLETIARWADGSFREAQTILEEAASQKKGKSVTNADIERVVGGLLSNDVSQYVSSVIRGDAHAAIGAVEGMIQRGGDVMTFARLALTTLRDRLVSEGSARVLEVTKKVEECTRTLKYSVLPQLPLEIAAMELAKEEGKTRSENSENSESQIVGNPEGQRDQTKHRSKSLELRSSGHSDSPASQSIQSFPKPPVSISLSNLVEKWPLVLESVRKKNHGIVTLLSHCRPLSVEEGIVLVEAKYQFHKDQLMQDRFRSLIEAEMSGIVGENIGIRFILGQKTERILKSFASDDNIRAVADDELVTIAEEIFTA